MTARVSIQTEDFDLAAEVAALRQGDGRVGAVCSFVGTVRDRNDGQSVSTMELEHYPGMTEKSIEAMIDAAHRRFDILGARVIHRVGLLHPLDQIVLVAVSSAHRGESFQACEFLMDYLKTQAPFWKKECCRPPRRKPSSARRPVHRQRDVPAGRWPTARARSATWPRKRPDPQEPGSRHRRRARRPEAWTAPRPKASARR
jgi:molybdopterin synthase catalytic subunit